MKELFEELVIDSRRPRRAPLRGAIGLIELGDRNAKPVMIRNAAPRRAFMGDILGDAAGFLFDIAGSGITKIAGILSGILKVPLDFLGTGVGALLTGFASIVSGIPIIGDFAATIILAVNSLAQFVIDIPETLLAQVANLGKAFQTLPDSAKSSAVTNAAKLIIGSAPPPIQPQVKAAIEKAPSPAGGTIQGDTFAEWAAAALAGLAAIGAFAFIR